MSRPLEPLWREGGNAPVISRLHLGFFWATSWILLNYILDSFGLLRRNLPEDVPADQLEGELLPLLDKPVVGTPDVAADRLVANRVVAVDLFGDILGLRFSLISHVRY